MRPDLKASFDASWKVSGTGYLFKPQTQQRKLGNQGLVCGAQGFGLDIARRFIKSGSKVRIWDIDEAELKKASHDINSEN